MKRNTKITAMTLVEQFDQQLREALMSDLKAIHNARINLIKHITFNNHGRDRLMTA
ncbi:hypothetical protein [Daejeonella sp. JGW-45]|uniref:hypothetical protein n=1 Tax=Daejeonella sp. JGW-45 TaxID=3034148 RepID=UPI0023EC9E5C|nr:hypothetical protein [Daejeonella sp. JGW-45]